MKKAIATIMGITPYQQSREKDSREPKKAKETHADYEQRTWTLRAHTNDAGNICIPPVSLKNAMVSAAKYSGKQIPGEGKKTYTQKVKSGLLVQTDLIDLGVSLDKCRKAAVFGSSTGKPGGGRVWKYFPTVDRWDAEVEFVILDDIITEEVFLEMLVEAGRYIGIGTWRPENGGEHGRFEVLKITWADATA
jgi:hypothetical protein